ncbi:MAG: hypothetical protein AB7W59_10060, partial [Acidimicrobiia bacterium]
NEPAGFCAPQFGQVLVASADKPRSVMVLPGRSDDGRPAEAYPAVPPPHTRAAPATPVSDAGRALRYRAAR